LPRAASNTLTPRKTPIQARSTATVDAILQATIQVLLAAGKERLTTTQVAARAGVSVGTLYQYFPNKSALLQACLRRHLDGVRQSIEGACEQAVGKGLLEMATALIPAYWGAKMRSREASAALYAVSSDLDGAAISKAATARAQRAVANLFASAREGLNKEPELVTTIVFAMLQGTTQRLLTSKPSEREVDELREQLTVAVHAYLQTCAGSPITRSREGTARRGPGVQRALSTRVSF
jgi:AcrR family transcriptional regulator